MPDDIVRGTPTLVGFALGVVQAVNAPGNYALVVTERAGWVHMSLEGVRHGMKMLREVLVTPEMLREEQPLQPPPPPEAAREQS